MKKTQSEVESRVVVGAHGVSAEEDHIVIWKIVGVAVAALVIFSAGGFWSYRILLAGEREDQPNGPAATPPAIGQYEIGIVNQRLIATDAHAETTIAAQRAALLNGWGKTPGVKVHPTVDEAITRVIGEQQQERELEQQEQQEQQPSVEPTPAPTK